MEIISVYLIPNKCTLGTSSPFNFDGSEFIKGLGVVPATSPDEALSLFKQYLENQKLGLLDTSRPTQYDPNNFKDGTEDSREIKELATKALEKDQIGYACGFTYDSEDELEEE